MPQTQPMNWLMLFFLMMVLLPAMISMVYFTYLQHGWLVSSVLPRVSKISSHMSMW